MYTKPLIVHEDRSIFLLEWLDPDGVIAQQLLEFADLIKAPDEIFTFELSPFALWSAAAKGISAKFVIKILQEQSQNEVNEFIQREIKRNIEDFGTVELIRNDKQLNLITKSAAILKLILDNNKINSMVVSQPNEVSLIFEIEKRMIIKKELFEMNLFARDATNELGEPLDIKLKPGISLRNYQKEAVQAYLENNLKVGGGGAIIMPPGSGKTLVGLKVMEELKYSTLILTENEQSALSWKDEILEKTDAADTNISMYFDSHELKPITICTYPNLSRENLNELISSSEWGLVIYDDAHRLPAETYLETTDIPSKHKIALASTLVRSDKRGNLVYALIGPKWYQILPRTLEKMGHQSPVICVEVKVPLSEEQREKYILSGSIKNKEGIAALNHLKMKALEFLLRDNWTKNILVVSYRIQLANSIGKQFQIPVVTGSNKNFEHIDVFNRGEINHLIISSIMEQIALPNLDLLIALTYHQGSEREEYLRIGKVMNVKEGKDFGLIYSLVSEGTIEEDYYTRRRRAMTNRGYRYRIISFEDLVEGRGNIEPILNA